MQPRAGLSVRGVRYALWALTHFPRMRVPRAYLGCLLYWAAEHAWQVRGRGVEVSEDARSQGLPGLPAVLGGRAHLAGEGRATRLLLSEELDSSAHLG